MEEQGEKRGRGESGERQNLITIAIPAKILIMKYVKYF